MAYTFDRDELMLDGNGHEVIRKVTHLVCDPNVKLPPWLQARQEEAFARIEAIKRDLVKRKKERSNGSN